MRICHNRGKSMNLNHLKYFYDSAMLQSMSKAAKINYVGQSAISRGIAALEESIDTKLIIHQKNNFLLTKEGEQILEKCQAIFSAVNGLHDLSKKDQSNIQGTFTFACSQSFAASFFPLFSKKLSEEYPLLSPQIKIGNGDSIMDWLKNERVDFGIVLEDNDKDNFEKQKLIEGNFYLVCSKKMSTKWEDEGVIISEERPETIRLRKLLSTKYEDRVPVKMKVASWGVIKQLVSEYAGAGLLPDYVIHKELLSGKFINCLPKTSNPYKLSVITQKNKALSNNAQVAIKLLLKTVKQLHPSDDNQKG